MPAPMGDIMVIVPVFTVQVSWVVVATGAEGTPGAGSTVTGTPGDIQPSVLFTETLYVPGSTKLNTGLDW